MKNYVYEDTQRKTTLPTLSQFSYFLFGSNAPTKVSNMECIANLLVWHRWYSSPQKQREDTKSSFIVNRKNLKVHSKLRIICFRIVGEFLTSTNIVVVPEVIFISLSWNFYFVFQQSTLELSLILLFWDDFFENFLHFNIWNTWETTLFCCFLSATNYPK